MDQQTLGIVWAETARLVSFDGSDLTKQRLQSVVGRLVDRARSLGSTANFARPALLPGIAPAPGGQQAEAMRQAVESGIATGQFNNVTLPRRAVLWEVTATGEPRETDVRLPNWAAWIKQGLATRTSNYKVEGDTTGRVFRLYESDAEPALDATSYVSGFTLSGVPVVAKTVGGRSGPWILGGVATLLFFWMILTLGWTGRTVTQTRDLMSGTPPEYAAQTAQALIKTCNISPQQPSPDASQPAFAEICAGPSGPEPAGRNEAGILQAMKACLAPQKDAPSALRTSPFCRLAWRTAAQKANSSEMTTLPRPFGQFFLTTAGWAAKPSGPTASISIALPMMGFVVSIAMLCIALGYGMKGQIFGIWISPQNRMSLARMQVSLWTVVVLGAFAALALFNIGELAEPIRDSYVLRPVGSEIPQAFPTMPAMILAALGIAVVSPMLSALIKSYSGGLNVNLQDRAQAADQSGIGRFANPVADGNLEVRSGPAQASLADFFTGETESDKDQIDIARVQNMVITFILVCSYAALLLGFAREIAPETVVTALEANAALFPSLPDPGGTFATLLAASHTTYLVAKRTALQT